MKPLFATLFLCAMTVPALARELHVSFKGNDQGPGTAQAPLRTIQRAADLAQPGDTITVHEGVYRERVNPPRGGESDTKRITYQAAPGERVEIKGSEVITGWTPDRDGVWTVSLPNSFFGGFNPYSDLIKGDWFDPRGREHHTGCVYLNGEWLVEAGKLEELYTSSKPLWFGRVDEKATTLWAWFGKADPNKESVEINVRQTVFYPDKPGRNFITVRGFVLRHAAPKWAPPTAEQMGLIGTHWSRGWVIEDNTISHSINVGLSLGKYGDEFDNLAPTAKAYNDSIDRAYANGWRKGNIGHHLVRNNTISHCEQAGIVGSMGASFSRIIGNHIFKIHTQGRFSGAEMAGIKFHAPIDLLVEGNRIHDTCRGLWLDWMTQGTRVTRNLLYRNGDDAFLEVNHGPCIVDNNLFLSTVFRNRSQGGAYVHNLFAGEYDISLDERATPYFLAHSTEKAGLAKIEFGDDRLYNNLFFGNGGFEPSEATREFAKKETPGFPRFVGRGLWVYDHWPTAPETGGNVYYHGAKPFAKERDFLLEKTDPALKLEERADGVYLLVTLDAAPAKTRLVTTERLGKARVTQLPFVQTDGAPLKINTDYFGNPRNPDAPRSGPFELVGSGRLALKIWPVAVTDL